MKPLEFWLILKLPLTLSPRIGFLRFFQDSTYIGNLGDNIPEVLAKLLLPSLEVAFL